MIFDTFLAGIDTLIHVGANEGQERQLYALNNLKVLWVEALPEVHRILAKNLIDYPEQTCIQALVTDSTGQLHTFHVSNNMAASSSVFEFAMHKDMWPEVIFSHDVELISMTLDEAVKRSAFKVAGRCALVMDTQGSELLVLKGAAEILKSFQFVKTEAADFESYVGGTTVTALVDYLAAHGFGLVAQEPFAEHPEGGRYFELLFKRRNLWRDWLYSLSRYRAKRVLPYN